MQDNFLQYAKGNRPYPADDSPYTSPALRITKRIVDKLSEGLDPGLTATRSLQVTSISDTHDHYQFAGDGTALHPPLYDRDTLAILPFQVNAGRFVIPYYVMTRDVTQSLIPEPFTIGLKGVNAGSVRVSAYDPLNDRPIPVMVNRGIAAMVKRGLPVMVNNNAGGLIAVTVNAADYPYLLIVDDGNGDRAKPEATEGGDSGSGQRSQRNLAEPPSSRRCTPGVPFSREARYGPEPSSR